MIGLMTGLILIIFILLVHFQLKLKPQNRDELLTNDNLPFPGASQGSSIFSLSALFSAYLAISLLVGLVATLGLAIGSLIGLIFVSKHIALSNAENFEQLITDKFRKISSRIFLLIISGTQLLLVVSEMIILNDILVFSLGFTISSAKIFIVCITLIAYYYCLYGGYLAVFITDVAQYIIIIIFGITLLIIVALKINFDIDSVTLNSSDLITNFKEKYWILFNIQSINKIYHFIISSLMGFAFIISSPDTWKRVFIVSKVKKKPFISFVIASFLPFIIVFSLFFLKVIDINKLIYLKFVFQFNTSIAPIFISILFLGLLSSFFSTFDSALISTIHMLMLSKKSYTGRNYNKKYHIYLSMIFFIIHILFFLILYNFNNSYFLANYLIVGYCLIGGILIGSKGAIDKIHFENIFWIASISLVGWFLFLIFYVNNIFKSPSLAQIDTVPFGVVLFVLITTVVRIISHKKELRAK